METINLIAGNSSDIYEFSSKQVLNLPGNWEGSWVVSDVLGGIPILEGILSKNINIYNLDSLIGEDFRKTFKIFEATNLEIVQFNNDIISGVDNEICTVSGRMYHDSTDLNGNAIEVPEANRYITITLKGVFVNYTRVMRIKTDINGNFSHDFNIGATIKTLADSFFIFQLMPLQSQQLASGSTFVLSVEVRELDVNGVPIFRREVLQAKLKMLAQGVL